MGLAMLDGLRELQTGSSHTQEPHLCRNTYFLRTNQRVSRASLRKESLLVGICNLVLCSAALISLDSS